MPGMEERKGLELNLENLSRLCRKMIEEGKPAICLMVPKDFLGSSESLRKIQILDVLDLIVKETTLLKDGGWWLVDEGGGIWEPEEEK